MLFTLININTKNTESQPDTSFSTLEELLRDIEQIEWTSLVVVILRKE
jgi:hypothetical protein